MSLLQYRNHQGLRYSEEVFLVGLLSVMSVLEDHRLTELCKILIQIPFLENVGSAPFQFMCLSEDDL